MSIHFNNSMDTRLKNRPKYRLKHIYQLLELVTQKDRKAIRKKMTRMDLQNDDEGFAEYLEYFYRRKFKINPE